MSEDLKEVVVLDLFGCGGGNVGGESEVVVVGLMVEIAASLMLRSDMRLYSERCSS